MVRVSRLRTFFAKTGDGSERAVLAATALLGVLFAVLAFRSMPSFEADVRRLGQTERRAIGAWNAIVRDVGPDGLADGTAADRIDREVLPVWRDARAQVARLEAGPWAGRLAPQLPAAFGKRQEAWEAMVAAARTGDPRQSRRAAAAWMEAERLVAELRRTTSPEEP